VEDFEAWVHARGGALARTAYLLARRVDLDLPDGIGRLSQWSGSVSPDGTLIYVTGDSEEAAVFSLPDGAVAERAAPQQWLCPVSWSDTGPRLAFDGSNVVAVRDDRDRPMITVDPAFEATCGIWGSDALSGSKHEGVAGVLFDTSNGWLSWHWREVAVGIGVGGALLLDAVVVRRRRKRLAPTS
jgi:hypothetical protein